MLLQRHYNVLVFSHLHVELANEALHPSARNTAEKYPQSIPKRI
jgi:hypothetical protein